VPVGGYFGQPILHLRVHDTQQALVGYEYVELRIVRRKVRTLHSKAVSSVGDRRLYADVDLVAGGRALTGDARELDADKLLRQVI
jgi:hypothetical protein